MISNLQGSSKGATMEHEYWSCVDCIMAIGNGDFPDDQAARLAMLENFAFIERNGKGSLFVGNDDRDFSWSPCETCGSTLGGSRHLVGLVAW